MGFHNGQNALYNLTNQKLATRWIVERWRAMRKNLMPVSGQKKCVVKCYRGGGYKTSDWSFFMNFWVIGLIKVIPAPISSDWSYKSQIRKNDLLQILCIEKTENFFSAKTPNFNFFAKFTELSSDWSYSSRSRTNNFSSDWSYNHT